MVTAPLGTDFVYIKSVIHRKSWWIAKKIIKMGRYRSIEPIKEYKTGQGLKILGRDYTIFVDFLEDG